LESGADVNFQNNQGEISIFLSFRNKNEKISKLLIDHNVDL